MKTVIGPGRSMTDVRSVACGDTECITRNLWGPWPLKHNQCSTCHVTKTSHPQQRPECVKLPVVGDDLHQVFLEKENDSPVDGDGIEIYIYHTTKIYPAVSCIDHAICAFCFYRL